MLAVFPVENSDSRSNTSSKHSRTTFILGILHFTVIFNFFLVISRKMSFLILVLQKNRQVTDLRLFSTKSLQRKQLTF